LEKLVDDDSAPVTTRKSAAVNSLPAGNPFPTLKEARSTRTVRDSDVSDAVKELHEYTCQICTTRLETPRGPYAEGCHIKPLGRPHGGPDVPENLLSLCPNCHVLFDELAIWIDDDLTIRGAASGKLRTHIAHKLSVEYFKHHRSMASASR
jgi:putative restriction endonuclease